MKLPEQAHRVERMSEERLAQIRTRCERGFTGTIASANQAAIQYAKDVIPELLAEAERARFVEADLIPGLARTMKDLAVAHSLLDERDRLRADLAASRAREAELAEALGHVLEQHADADCYQCAEAEATVLAAPPRETAK